MIQVTPQMRILVALEAVDFRKGIDGLMGMCRSAMGLDPFSGYVFVFRNKRKTSIIDRKSYNRIIEVKPKNCHY